MLDLFRDERLLFIVLILSGNDTIVAPAYILNEDTQLVMRAIGVSHTACKDELRRNLRSHSWSVFSFFIIVAPVAYQVILEPGIGQFREFESPRVHTRIN